MRFVQCSGDRPECARCTKRGRICEYSVRESRVNSAKKTKSAKNTRSVTPFLAKYLGGGGTGGERPTPVHHSRRGVKQKNTFERTPAYAHATGRCSLLPAALHLSPTTSTSSSIMYLPERQEREFIIPRRELDAGQWDLSPSPLQSRSQMSMNSSFEAPCTPPDKADNLLYSSHTQAQDEGPNPFVYNSTGPYAPPDCLAHPTISASSSESMYDGILPADYNVGDPLGIGELSFQHFLTQVTNRLSILDALLMLFHSNTSIPLVDSSQYEQRQKKGDRATQGRGGAPSQYPHHAGYPDTGSFAGVGTTVTKDGTASDLHSLPFLYNSTLDFATWDTSGNTTQADFGVEILSMYEACNAEKQQHQEQEMLVHVLEGFSEISSQHYHSQTRPPQQSQDALELMCSTPGIAMGAYGVHSTHQRVLILLQTWGCSIQGCLCHQTGLLTAHYDAPRTPITAPHPESSHRGLNFLK